MNISEYLKSNQYRRDITTKRRIAHEEMTEFVKQFITEKFFEKLKKLEKLKK